MLWMLNCAILWKWVPAEVSDFLLFRSSSSAFSLWIHTLFRDWKVHKAECKEWEQREQVREEARKQLPEDLQEKLRA